MNGCAWPAQSNRRGGASQIDPQSFEPFAHELCAYEVRLRYGDANLLSVITDSGIFVGEVPIGLTEQAKLLLINSYARRGVSAIPLPISEVGVDHFVSVLGRCSS